jgi:hypothetical protein
MRAGDGGIERLAKQIAQLEIPQPNAAGPLLRVQQDRQVVLFLRLALFHHAKLAVDELIVIQATLVNRMCRPVGDGENKNTGECNDHREESRVFIRVDSMCMPKHLDPNSRTEDGQRDGRYQS